MDTADVLKEKYELPPFKPGEAEGLLTQLQIGLLGYTTNSFGNFYFLDVSINPEDFGGMQKRAALKTMLRMIQMPAFEEEGAKVKDLAGDETMQKKVDVVFYRAEDINKLIVALNRTLATTGDAILSSSKVIDKNQTYRPVPGGAD